MSDESKPSSGGNPPDWRERWNFPLLWPGTEIGDPKAQGSALSALEDASFVLIDVDKKSLDRQIGTASASDRARGDALARRIYEVVLPNCIRLVDHFRAKQRPVIFV